MSRKASSGRDDYGRPPQGKRGRIMQHSTGLYSAAKRLSPTNFVLRGLASGMVLMGLGLVTLLLAFLGWWDQIFGWFGGLKIHLNLGAYFWFSSLLCVAWVVCVFGVDRVSYWEIKPGQFTHQSLFGAGSKS